MKRISQLNVSVETSALSALNYKHAVCNPLLSFSNFCILGFNLTGKVNKVLHNDLSVLLDAVKKDKKGRLMIVTNDNVSTIITNDFVISKLLEQSLRKSNIFFHDIERDGIEPIKDIISFTSSITLIQ